MRATRPGRQRDRRPPARPPGEPGRLLVRLVTRLVVAQAIAAAAVGLPFSKRQLSSILITLAMVAALCGLAFLVRSGTKTAWLVALGFEVAFIGFGLSRFFGARYAGWHPVRHHHARHPASIPLSPGPTTVAAAAARPQEPPDELGLGDAPADTCGGQIRGLGPVAGR